MILLGFWDAFLGLEEEKGDGKRCGRGREDAQAMALQGIFAISLVSPPRQGICGNVYVSPAL